MRTKKYFLALFVVAASLVSCDDEMPDYYDSRSYDLQGFDAVELGDALQVEIIKANTFSVVAKGETPDLDDLQLRVEGGVLTGNYRYGSRNHKRTMVVIYMPHLADLRMGAATDTKVIGFRNPQEMFFLRLSGASAATIEMNAALTEVRIDGASEAVLRGEGAILDGIICGASRLNARDFSVPAALIDVGGASEALVYVREQLEGSVQGSSMLRYKGNPEYFDVYVASDSRLTRY